MSDSIDSSTLPDYAPLPASALGPNLQRAIDEIADAEGSQVHP